MKLHFLKSFLLFSTVLIVFTSCSKDEDSNLSDEKATTTFGAKATFNNGRYLSNIEISKFLVNIEDFELEFDGDHYYTDIELEGPFVLDLSQPNIVFPIVDVDIPIGVYEELEFEIKRSRESNSELFQRSILIEGTVNETPFVFWHNFEEDVEIDFEDTNVDIIIEQDGDSLILNFDLTFLFNTNIINLAGATDANGDGIIEISPFDTDGNNALAQQIKELIKDAIDLLDD